MNIKETVTFFSKMSTKKQDLISDEILETKTINLSDFTNYCNRMV